MGGRPPFFMRIGEMANICYLCSMKSIVEIFSELSLRLQSIPSQVIERAVEQNRWFTQIGTAIEAIREQMLDSQKLTSWLNSYDTPIHAPKRIAIIMAGNIPAVGFADLLYVIASGNIPVVKYSSKDRVLMEHIVNELQDIEPQLIIEQYSGQNVDAVIATGSDSAALHFKAIFGDIPALIRGSRHSVAVLTGKESEQEIENLSKDIFTHSGLGCRNVSLIFAPEDFDFKLTVPPMPEGYNNNYRHVRALLTLQGKRFTDCGGALTTESDAAFSRYISLINICRYSDINYVKQWLSENGCRLQCVASHEKIDSRSVEFGRAQYPELNDYADEVDVMKFLLSL